MSSLTKVFFASTAAVYADSPTPVSEESPTFPLDIYGLTKSIGERLVLEFHRATGVPCTIGRLFNAYGPRETNAHLIPEILRQVLEGKETIELGNLKTRRDYIHTSDMARAIVQLLFLKNAGFDVFNIGSGKSYDARQIVHLFEGAANRPLCRQRRNGSTAQVGPRGSPGGHYAKSNRRRAGLLRSSFKRGSEPGSRRQICLCLTRCDSP